MSHHRLRTTLSIAACTAAALTFAAGCGSDDSAGGGAAPPTPTTTTAGLASSTPTGGSDTTAGATTPPGEFAIGQEVSLIQQQFTASGAESFDTLIGVTVTKVTPGKKSDLKNFKLDADAKRGTPVYVHAKFQNQSDRTFNGQGMAGALMVRNADGADIQKINLIGDFPKCEGSPPEKFKPGKTAKTCDVYLLEAGEQIATIRHGDKFAADYLWKVD